jgi:pimeloyl-ACP methyl ester carboxylesterase
VRLVDPPVSVRVTEVGDGPPLVFVHGGGMSASTWAPLMPYLATDRLIAFDLPGFGLSDPFDYSGRRLRSHAVAQLTSLLGALGLEQAPVVGTSLGGMWALCPALDARRIASPPSRRSESPPSRWRACTARLPLPRSPRPACASSSRGSDRRASRRHVRCWLAERSAPRRRASPRGVLRRGPRGDASARLPNRGCSPTCNSPCGSADPGRRTSSQTPNCGSSRSRS